MYARWIPLMLLAVILFIGLGSLSGCPGQNPTNPTEGESSIEGESTSEGETALQAMEIQAFDLVNAERVAQGLNPLQMDEALRAVARAHSADMVARSFFDHVNPDGMDPFERMGNAGITFSAAAENIAANSGHADPADVAVTGWMNSPGHRTNILNGIYTHTGMGLAYDDAANEYFFTQVFTKP